MTQPEIELKSELTRFFREVIPHGGSSWSVALQNGRSHLSRIIFDDEVLCLTTGPLGIQASPEDVAALNASLPASSRIVCTVRGLLLRTECRHWPDLAIAEICMRAIADFRTGLDLCFGAPIAQLQKPMYALETQDPAAHWKASPDGDGRWTIALPDHRGVLEATDALVKVNAIEFGEWPQEVRFATTEYLLRVTSRLRFVKACATSDLAEQWSAWLQASPAVCGMEQALTSVALAHEECAAAVKALTELRLAKRFQEMASIWRTKDAEPFLKERR